MANERAMPAKSVSTLLDLARTKQLGGRLTIRQQGSGSIQEGELYLQAGQPIFVRLGSMVGQEALTRLLSWRNVLFTFQPDEPGMVSPGLSVGQGKDTTSFLAPSDILILAQAPTSVRMDEARLTTRMPGMSCPSRASRVSTRPGAAPGRNAARHSSVVVATSAAA